VYGPKSKYIPLISLHQITISNFKIGWIITFLHNTGLASDSRVCGAIPFVEFIPLVIHCLPAGLITHIYTHTWNIVTCYVKFKEWIKKVHNHILTKTLSVKLYHAMTLANTSLYFAKLIKIICVWIHSRSAVRTRHLQFLTCQTFFFLKECSSFRLIFVQIQHSKTKTESCLNPGVWFRRSMRSADGKWPGFCRSFLTCRTLWSWISSRIVLYYNSSVQLGLQGAIFRMGGGRLRQVGWRGGNKSSSEGTSSWWLPMAYIQPAANTHTHITSRGRGLQSEYLILVSGQHTVSKYRSLVHMCPHILVPFSCGTKSQLASFSLDLKNCINFSVQFTWILCFVWWNMVNATCPVGSTLSWSAEFKHRNISAHTIHIWGDWQHLKGHWVKAKIPS
jgi:hypothetical protein